MLTLSQIIASASAGIRQLHEQSLLHPEDPAYRQAEEYLHGVRDLAAHLQDSAAPMSRQFAQFHNITATLHAVPPGKEN